MLDLKDIHLDTFQPLVGAGFTTTLPDGDITLVLREATAMGKGLREGGAFSLLFSGPDGVHLPQGVFSLAHAEIGGVELFLVPVGDTTHGWSYEAVCT